MNLQVVQQKSSSVASLSKENHVNDAGEDVVEYSEDDDSDAYTNPSVVSSHNNNEADPNQESDVIDQTTKSGCFSMLVNRFIANFTVEVESHNSTNTGNPVIVDNDNRNSQKDIFVELQKTNQMLEKLVKEVKKTEKHVLAIEEKLDTSTSTSTCSSSGSGSYKQSKKVLVSIRACT